MTSFFFFFAQDYFNEIFFLVHEQVYGVCSLVHRQAQDKVFLLCSVYLQSHYRGDLL